MPRGDLPDLASFLVIAEEGSFTRAAAKLGVSTSALSHAMRALEERLGVRLLARTSRSVSVTEAGEELLRTLRPALESIDGAVTALARRRDKPSGTIRITSVMHAVTSVIWPVLPGFVAEHPDVTVELVVDYGLRNIVAERFDAGIRFGEMVEKDMIALRVGPDLRMAVVASPAYLAGRPAPVTPRDLGAHRCINYRLISSGGLYAWEFEKDGEELQVRVDGPLTFNEPDLMLKAALDGMGVAYLFEDQVTEHVASGRLVRLLEDWCAPFPGFFLYYPSRRQQPPALAAFVNALRRGWAARAGEG
ncbi:LysR family transcriptional regulator [Azospirillum sp. SYSU D00513]|uniref:LysR family transcriptional regulator n=1 Tax=Azospirillum sp. SYSU D00513 TaxID=2812561 RepID=UPI001A9768A8|nr:LysR family transcriptional regulator [Azospirillum sp. SYSU D00513]